MKITYLNQVEIENLKQKLEDILIDYAKIKNLTISTLLDMLDQLIILERDDANSYGYFSDEGYAELVKEYAEKYKKGELKNVI